MAVKLKWSPRVVADSQKIYRSASPFALDSLPTALATIGATVSEYTDETPPNGPVYYAVSAVSGAKEALSRVEWVLVTGGEVTPPAEVTLEIIDAGPGSWTWFNDKRAIKLSDTSIAVQAIDTKNGQGVNVHKIDLVTGGVVTNNTWSKGFTGGEDDHNNGALLKLSSGTALSALAAHPSSGIYIGRSTDGDPTNITTWTNVDSQVGLSSYTYANLFEMASNEIFLFGRATTAPSSMYYSKSTDDGVTWSTGTEWLDGTSGYSAYVNYEQKDASRIDFIMTTGHPRDTTNSVYHGYFDGTGFYKTDGTSVAIPANPSDFTLVYDGSSTNAWVWDLKWIDGELHGLITAYPGGTSSHEYRRISLSGTTWLDELVGDGGSYIHKVPASGFNNEDHYSGGAALDPEDADVVFASVGDYARADLFKFDRVTSGVWGATKLMEIDYPGTKILRPTFIADPRLLLVFAGEYVTFKDMTTNVLAIDPDRITPSPAPGGRLARAWRLRNLISDDNDDNTQIANIEFRATVGGSDETDTLPGNAIASSTYSGSSTHQASNAFNGSTANRWAASGMLDQWIGWDAGAGNSFELAEVLVREYASVSRSRITFGLVEYSDDAATWHPYCFMPGGPLFADASVETGDYVFPVADYSHLFTETPVSEAYRYYRIDMVQVGEETDGAYSGSAFVIENIKLRNGVGSNLVIAEGGSAIASHEGGSNPASNAFLEDTSLFSSGNSLGMRWIGWDFGDGNEQQIADVQIKSRPSGILRAPTGLLIRASNNGRNWTTLKVEFGQSWTFSETKTYIV